MTSLPSSDSSCCKLGCSRTSSSGLGTAPSCEATAGRLRKPRWRFLKLSEQTRHREAPGMTSGSSSKLSGRSTALSFVGVSHCLVFRGGFSIRLIHFRLVCLFSNIVTYYTRSPSMLCQFPLESLIDVRCPSRNPTS